MNRIWEYEPIDVWCEKRIMKGGFLVWRRARRVRSIWGKQGVRWERARVCVIRISERGKERMRKQRMLGW